MSALALRPIVAVQDGAARTSSRDVAAFFGKRHGDVLRAIDALIAAAPGCQRNFAQGYDTRPDTGSQQHRYFDMDRTGFTVLVMGFTGATPLEFKLAYIGAFDAMEAELAGRPNAGGTNFKARDWPSAVTVDVGSSLSAKVKSEFGGIVKSVVGALLRERVVAPVNPDHVTALGVLVESGVPSRGRKALVARASHALYRFSSQRGVHVPKELNTNTRLFSREIVGEWRQTAGDAMIARHLDAVCGQGRLQLTGRA